MLALSATVTLLSHHVGLLIGKDDISQAGSVSAHEVSEISVAPASGGREHGDMCMQTHTDGQATHKSQARVFQE